MSILARFVAGLIWWWGRHADQRVTSFANLTNEDD